VDVGEDVDAWDRERERDTVAEGSNTECGEHDHRQELDGGDGAERQPVDREVEAAVHGGEDGAEGDE
jgi:hypothetical protein